MSEHWDGDRQAREQRDEPDHQKAGDDQSPEAIIAGFASTALSEV